jgi:hypothetical protein
MIPRAMLAVAYATYRAFHARQVKGDDPDKKGYPRPSRWGFGVGLTTPHSKKPYCYESRQKERGILFDRPKPTVGCSANGKEIYIHIYIGKNSLSRKNRKAIPHYRLSQVEIRIIVINVLVGNLCKAPRNVNTFVDFTQTENNNCSRFTLPQQY